MCTAVLIGWDPAPPPPHLGSYTRALYIWVSQDRRHLFVTPALDAWLWTLSWNNSAALFQCCYITVNFATAASQNGFSTFTPLWSSSSTYFILSLKTRIHGNKHSEPFFHSLGMGKNRDYLLCVGFHSFGVFLKKHLPLLVLLRKSSWSSSIVHWTKNPITVFQEKELRSISPNSYIHVIWAIYIFPGWVHIFGCSKTDRPILEIYTVNLSQIYECRNWETTILFWNEAAQFHFWKYINGNQTFIMDSHQPLICSICLFAIYKFHYS